MDPESPFHGGQSGHTGTHLRCNSKGRPVFLPRQQSRSSGARWPLLRTLRDRRVAPSCLRETAGSLSDVSQSIIVHGSKCPSVAPSKYLCKVRPWKSRNLKSRDWMFAKWQGRLCLALTCLRQVTVPCSDLAWGPVKLFLQQPGEVLEPRHVCARWAPGRGFRPDCTFSGRCMPCPT